MLKDHVGELLASLEDQAETGLTDKAVVKFSEADRSVGLADDDSETGHPDTDISGTDIQHIMKRDW